MLTFAWHELYREESPGELARTGIDSPGKATYAVGARRFAEQLDALLQTGLRIGTLGSAPALGITFDDGGRSNRELAAPLLRARGLRAHFCVCAGLLGRPGFLGAEDLRALAAEGHVIGSHGLWHRALPALGDAALREELVRSRAQLEQLLGQPCTLLALPFGQRSARVLEACWEAGYETVFTSALPDGREGRVLGRYSVRADWSPARLRGLARGGRLAGARERTRYVGSALLGRLQRLAAPAPSG